MALLTPFWLCVATIVALSVLGLRAWPGRFFKKIGCTFFLKYS